MLRIFGAKGKIEIVEDFFKKIDEFSVKYELVIQVVDADYVFGKNHLKSAVNHAQRTFLNHTNSLNSLPLELLLYVSGERQVQKAINKIGINKSTENVAFIIISKDKIDISNQIIDEIISFFKLKRNDKVLEGDLDTLKKFGIKKDEIETISTDKYGDLILEKVALVDIIK